MRVHKSFVLSSLALLPLPSLADPLPLKYQAQQRSIGNASLSVTQESSTVDMLPSTSSTSQSCTIDWNEAYYPGFGRSTFTTTVTIVVQQSASECSAVSEAPTEVDETTETTTSTVTSTRTTQAATVTIPRNATSPAVSKPSSAPREPEQTSYTHSDDTPSEITVPEMSSSYTSSSLTDSDTFSNSAQTTASVSIPAASPSYTTSDCSREPFNKTANDTVYFGFNVVNQKPSNPQMANAYKTSTEEWQTTFAVLKQNFPQINAVRMYSITDGTIPHLMNAMPAAKANDLSIVVGVWSGGPELWPRFGIELSALEKVILNYGCSNIAAISVGNEDLNQVNVNNPLMSEDDKDETKQKVADTLLQQILQTRNLTRHHGCCNVPITHTDTWNEFSNTSKPWIPNLIRAVDQTVIVNIFPYWSHAQVTNSWQMLAQQANLTAARVKDFGKDVWLGETGWAINQPQPDSSFNEYGTNQSDAQQYFNQVGCQVLQGTGSAFYYADYDQDAPNRVPPIPSFGVLDYNGQPLLDISCRGYKPDMRIKDYEYLPAFMGVSQTK